MWYLAVGLARGWESYNFSFNITVDNFPVCAHAVLGSPEILRGLSPILGAICSPGNISGEPSTAWAHTGKLSTVLLKLKLWDSKALAAKPMAKYHISVVFSIKLLLKLILLKVSSVFNLGQRKQWNFPSLSCGALHQHLSGSFQQRS